ncbi:glutathione S-transferase family protein [Novosphingobium sp. FGD1]|jgi:glutathione S-transferase|uniref:Glutathione S-transferase family protein n=1 Tax=Novosphingobium silvae TaxID=2692619 RepID=A0A7X4GFP8_9SPHN|nr:glutathione S-transferase family protein [Novosphingobium silvae]MYL96917.1 glutathione S-transferase family protein [Novosphingobium silvae]
MPIDPDAELEITAFEWVPSFAQGQVRDLRPRWACEEYGVPYRVRLISAVERPKWYYADQPWGQVPFVRDGAVRVFESGATLIHIAEKAGALPPQGSQERARVLSWLLAAFNSVEPLMMELANVSIFSRKEVWAGLRKPSLVAELDTRLSRLEAALDGEWLAGDFSVADIAMATILRALPGSGAGAQVLDGHLALAAYLERALARPAFARALDAQLAPFAEHDPRMQKEGA